MCARGLRQSVSATSVHGSAAVCVCAASMSSEIHRQPNSCTLRCMEKMSKVVSDRRIRSKAVFAPHGLYCFDQQRKPTSEDGASGVNAGVSTDGVVGGTWKIDVQSPWD
jgi:hypothetical protein